MINKVSVVVYVCDWIDLSIILVCENDCIFIGF